MNAFELARPRGTSAEPSKAPRKTNHSRAPSEGSLRDLHVNTGEDREALKAEAIKREIESVLRESRTTRVTRRRNAAEKSHNAHGYNSNK